MDSFIRSYFLENKEAIFQEFAEFLSFQSISSEQAFAKETRQCALWLQDRLEKLGFSVELLETIGHPTLLARFEKAPGQPTLLLYNHYDVQPVDPIEEWTTPPFQASIREGNIFARGAQDNKGQLFYTFQAIKAILAHGSTLPINLKWCIEGEEECGSQGLFGLLQTQEEKFKADYLAVVDCGIQEKNTPAVTLGVRGIVTFDVHVQGANQDVHSGTYGGIIMNPIEALVRLLATLKDENGRILIPGFYDGITPLENKDLFALQFDTAAFKASMDTLPCGGEKAFSPLERAWMRPTIEINGISGGYQGSGFKTVIPKSASCKLSCRLVPGQDPEEIQSKVKTFLENQSIEGVKVSVVPLSGNGKAVRANPNSPLVSAFTKAYQTVFEKKPDFILGGGSIPIAAELAKKASAETVFVGLGLPTDHIHAPDEHFGQDRFEKGYLMIASALQYLKTTQSG